MLKGSSFNRIPVLARFSQMKASGDYFVTVIEDTRKNEIIGADVEEGQWKGHRHQDRTQHPIEDVPVAAGSTFVQVLHFHFINPIGSDSNL